MSILYFILTLGERIPPSDHITCSFTVAAVERVGRSPRLQTHLILVGSALISLVFLKILRLDCKFHHMDVCGGLSSGAAHQFSWSERENEF